MKKSSFFTPFRWLFVIFFCWMLSFAIHSCFVQLDTVTSSCCCIYWEPWFKWFSGVISGNFLFFSVLFLLQLSLPLLILVLFIIKFELWCSPPYLNCFYFSNYNHLSNSKEEDFRSRGIDLRICSNLFIRVFSCCNIDGYFS